MNQLKFSMLIFDWLNVIGKLKTLEGYLISQRIKNNNKIDWNKFLMSKSSNEKYV